MDSGIDEWLDDTAQAAHERDQRPGNDRARRARRGRRRALIVMVSAFSLLLTGTFGVVALVQHRIASQLELISDPFVSIADRPEQQPASGGTAPVNILVVGTDSRVSAGDPLDWEYGAQRTDAIMLVHVSGDRQSVQVMSIPRDSWVEIPGHGTAKINAAYSFGGPSLLIETVEQLTGVFIDHLAVADFESFATVTDELGGVEITLPDGMDRLGFDLEPGTHRLTGEQALAYVRDRFSTSGGDFDRVQRQQSWIRAILSESLDSDVLTNPMALTHLLETGASAIAVDEGFTLGAMRDLALSLRDVRPHDLTFLTVPLDGIGTSEDGQSIVLLDQPGFDALMDAVASDTAADYVETHPDLTVLDGAVA